MGKEGQNKVSRVITSRVTEKNVDRLAEILSSNQCENFFSIMVKYTEGKRRFLGQSDSLEVLVQFVAGIKSGVDMGSSIMEELGVHSMQQQRAKHHEKKMQRRERDRKQKSTDKYHERRIASKQMKANQMAKDDKSKNKHASDKLHPTENCRSNRASAPTPKPRRCGNCHQFGHFAPNCPEPARTALQKSRPKKRGQKRDQSVEEVFALFSK